MDESTVHGSCLCREVAFEVGPPFHKMVHCHCSRCRKATGTGHATNLIADPGQLQWLAGEDRIKATTCPQQRASESGFAAGAAARSHAPPAMASCWSFPRDRWSALASRVKQLITAGVQPEDITLVGFSRGGEITALAASALKPLSINTVLLATCWKDGVQKRPSITLSGRFLSIYETTDVAHSCKELAGRSNALSSFQEIAINTGKEHGAFYIPLPEWIKPLRAWIDNDTHQAE